MRIVAEHIQDHPGTLELILEVRRVDQNLLVEFDGKIEMLHENRGFVAGVFVEPDLTDSEHPRSVEELGDHGDDFPRQGDIFRFLGVNAEPSVVLNTELGRPLRFELSQLAEIIAKTLDAPSIEAGPERRFAHCDAAHFGERLIIVGGPRDHMDVRVDVIHGSIAPGL